MDKYIEVPLRIYDENKDNENLYHIARFFEKKIHALVNDCMKKKHVYRITSRVKKKARLIQKIQALYRKDELNELTDDEVFFRVTDLIGLRIVCRFIDELKEIDEVIRKSNAFKIKENRDNPLVEAYVIDEDDIKYIYKDQTYIKKINTTTWVCDKKSDKKIFEMKIKPMRYASVHYLVEPIESFKIDAIDNLVKSGLLVEIQLRSLFQECWAELEHEVSYKIYSEKKEEFRTLSEILHPLDKHTMSIRNYILDEVNEKGFRIFRDRINSRFPDIFEYVAKEMDECQKIFLDQNNGWLSSKLDSIKTFPSLYMYLLGIDGDLKILLRCLEKYKEFAINEKNDEECVNDIKCILIRNFFENIKRRRPDQYKKVIKDYRIDEGIYETVHTYLICWLSCVNKLIEHNVIQDLESHLKEMWEFILRDKESSLVTPKIIAIILKAWQNIDKETWTNMIKDFVNGYDIVFTKQTITCIMQSFLQSFGDARDEHMSAIVDTVKKAASTWNDQDFRENIQAIIKQWEQGKHPNTIDAK